MNKFTLFALSLVASAATITPVVAAEPAEPAASTSIVRTADLDLGSISGQRTLEHRLSIAIVEACGQASNVDLEGQNAVRACRVEARAKVAAERDRLVELASQSSHGTLVASAR
jgi:UrcA family protein